MPVDALKCRDSNCNNIEHIYGLQSLYSDIVTSLTSAAHNSIPTTSVGKGFNIVPGWNEQVRNFHNTARDAFKLWAANGRPRTGPLYELMRKTRAKFKSVFRACKRDERQARADSLANNLTQGGSRKFWNSVSATRNCPLPTNVGGCCGHENIANMI